VNIREIQTNIELLDSKEILNFCFNIFTALINCIESKSSTIHPGLEFPEELKEIKLKLDEILLKQILLNFISNAVKFNKFGMIKLQTKLNESQNF
jgi:signal transduction histidine kinase